MIDGYESPGQTRTYQMGTMFQLIKRAELAVLEVVSDTPLSQQRILTQAKNNHEDIPSSFIKYAYWHLMARGSIIKEGKLVRRHI
jgi:hypothetical protein